MEEFQHCSKAKRNRSQGPGSHQPPAISHQPPGGAVGNGKDKKGESGRETGGQAGSQGKGRVLLNQGKVGHHKWRRTRSDTRGRGPASGPGCPAPRQRPWLSRTPPAASVVPHPGRQRESEKHTRYMRGFCLGGRIPSWCTAPATRIWLPHLIITSGKAEKTCEARVRIPPKRSGTPRRRL